jgi:hypothetical protein
MGKIKGVLLRITPEKQVESRHVMGLSCGFPGGEGRKEKAALNAGLEGRGVRATATSGRPDLEMATITTRSKWEEMGIDNEGCVAFV